MARIVLTSWGSFGDLYPYLGLGAALRARGHQAVLAVPTMYQALVEAEGLEFQQAGPDVDVFDRGLAARLMDPAKGTNVIFDEVLLPNLARTHEELMRATEGADVLVGHPAAPAAVVVAEERGLPWASSVLAPLSFFSATDPVVPPPAPWVYSLTSRSIALSRAFLWLTDRVTQQWAAPIARFRVARGLPAGENALLAGQHSPHLVLAMFSRVLAAPQADWPASMRVTGAVLYNGRDEFPTDLARFLDAGPPPIVFTLGTSAVLAAGTFYQVSAEAAMRLKRRAVLLVGPYAENRPDVQSEDVFPAEFAPHAPLFARAAAIVH